MPLFYWESLFDTLSSTEFDYYDTRLWHTNHTYLSLGLYFISSEAITHIYILHVGYAARVTSEQSRAQFLLSLPLAFDISCIMSFLFYTQKT